MLNNNDSCSCKEQPYNGMIYLLENEQTLSMLYSVTTIMHKLSLLFDSGVTMFMTMEAFL